jgi:16S rRNA (cytosine1402-N4)-methyltransferase
MENNYHSSVLLKEAIDALNVQSGGQYIDGTLGGGGHTGRILEMGGVVLGIDTDEDAIRYVEEKFKVQSSKFKIKVARGNFRDIDEIAKKEGFDKVDGVLLDLGVSSHQFDTAQRGFSLQADGPLDMRMSSELTVKAKDLLNALTKDELSELFTRLGEEPWAKRIAGAIVDARKTGIIETTKELAEIIKRSVPRSMDRIHPATRVFQALRIAVNDELHTLQEALPKAERLLRPGGRLVVISFHSLEDRIVKHMFKEFVEKRLGTIITDKPVVPSEQEIGVNPRSRSAKMRVYERE